MEYSRQQRSDDRRLGEVWHSRFVFVGCQVAAAATSMHTHSREEGFPTGMAFPREIAELEHDLRLKEALSVLSAGSMRSALLTGWRCVLWVPHNAPSLPCKIALT